MLVWPLVYLWRPQPQSKLRGASEDGLKRIGSARTRASSHCTWVHRLCISSSFCTASFHASLRPPISSDRGRLCRRLRYVRDSATVHENLVKIARFQVRSGRRTCVPILLKVAGVSFSLCGISSHFQSMPLEVQTIAIRSDRAHLSDRWRCRSHYPTWYLIFFCGVEFWAEIGAWFY